MGLMQIMPATWADLRARHRLGSDPYDPCDNILAGVAYLCELHDRQDRRDFWPPTMPAVCYSARLRLRAIQRWSLKLFRMPCTGSGRPILAVLSAPLLRQTDVRSRAFVNLS